MKTQPLTYKVTYFAGPKRFVAVAWNYDIPALFASGDHATYQHAKDELQLMAEMLGYELKNYEGEFRMNPGTRHEVPAL